MGMIGYAKASGEMVRVFRLLTATVGMQATPPASFRHWYHVNTMVIAKGSPLFEAMGGMHNV